MSTAIIGVAGNPWRYVLEADFACHVQALAGVHWEQKEGWAWICDGWVRIRAGYAWDGCSPKLRRPLFGLFHLGTPDGPWHLGRNPTYQASLVHDVLCQWAQDIPITRKQSIAAFDFLLRESGWRYRTIYVWAVRLFGPRQFLGDKR